MCIWKMWPEILCGVLGASPSSWLGSYSLVALPDICLLVQTYSSPLTIQRSNTMRSGRLVLCLSKTCCCILLLALIAPFKFPPIALKEEKAQKLTSKTMYVQDCFVSCNKEKKRLNVIKTMYVHSVSFTVNVYVLYLFCLIIWGWTAPLRYSPFSKTTGHPRHSIFSLCIHSHPQIELQWLKFLEQTNTNSFRNVQDSSFTELMD